VDQFIVVPLKSDESAMPIYGTGVPQTATVNTSQYVTDYQDVRLDDSSRYATVPMVLVDNLR